MKKDTKKAVHEGHRDRLRQAADKDPEMESFSDFEVLEYLLSFLIPRKDTNKIAHELIDTFGSFYGVLCANCDELFEIHNMTKTASHFLPNLLTVLRKAEMSRTKRYSYVGTVASCVEAFRPYFLGRNQELFYLMLLDVNDYIISVDCLSRGAANYTSIDMAAIAAKVSRSQACKIVLAHNHPGGNLSPSNEDLHVTSAISHLMNSMGRELVDHLIFCGENFYSFFENHHMTRLIENADKVFGTNKSKEIQSKLFVSRYVSDEELARHNEREQRYHQKQILKSMSEAGSDVVVDGGNSYKKERTIKKNSNEKRFDEKNFGDRKFEGEKLDDENVDIKYLNADANDSAENDAED